MQVGVWGASSSHGYGNRLPAPPAAFTAESFLGQTSSGASLDSTVTGLLCLDPGHTGLCVSFILTESEPRKGSHRGLGTRNAQLLGSD